MVQQPSVAQHARILHTLGGLDSKSPDARQLNSKVWIAKDVVLVDGGISHIGIREGLGIASPTKNLTVVSGLRV